MLCRRVFGRRMIAVRQEGGKRGLPARAEMLLELVLVLAGAEPVACPKRRRRGGVRRVTATRWRLLSAPTHRQAAGARSPRNRERREVNVLRQRRT